MAKRFLVTGGTGFLGNALVRRLLAAGRRVRVLDDDSRGDAGRLADVARDVELVNADIRDAGAVRRACAGMDAVCHLAAVNGTSNFYERPDLVLDVGVRGIFNVLEGCRGERVRELFVASSSEVYQSPAVVPTPETAPLTVPDPHNPRYSYATSKIVSEMAALHVGGKFLDRAVIFRPHNVYGPDMGREHVVPQFILRMIDLSRDPADPLPFPIQGTGRETRAFVYVDDFTEGLMTLLEQGGHREIYHIGTEEETCIADVAHAVAERFGRRIVLVEGPPAPGGTTRRCPDLGKLRALGYAPKVPFREGLARTVRWHLEGDRRRPASAPGEGGR